MVKRLFTYVFAVFGIVLVMGFPISGEEQMIGENLLSNSSFEEVDQDGRPLSYIIGAFQGSPQILVDDTVFRTGSKSIKITGDGDDRGALSKHLVIEGGKFYRVGIWYRTTDTIALGKAILRLTAFKTTSPKGEADKVPWKMEWLIDPYEGEYGISGNMLYIYNWESAVNEWKYLTAAFRLPQEVKSFTIDAFNHLGNGTVWFDDILLIEIESASLELGLK